MSWFLNFCWRTDLRKKQLFRIPSRLSRWTWCRPFTPDAVPATHAALVPASARQCCTSFSTSLGGGWRCASSHRGPCWSACVWWCLSNEHPPPRLASQRPIWLDMTSVDTVTQWREDWSSASVVNHTVVTDPVVWRPGFGLPRHAWSLVDCLWSGQGPCHANLHKWSRPITFLWLWPAMGWQNLKVDWIYSTKRMMMQSYGWSIQRLQHSRNNDQMQWGVSPDDDTCHRVCSLLVKHTCMRPSTCATKTFEMHLVD